MWHILPSHAGAVVHTNESAVLVLEIRDGLDSMLPRIKLNIEELHSGQ